MRFCRFDTRERQAAPIKTVKEMAAVLEGVVAAFVNHYLSRNHKAALWKILAEALK
jgi:hypothetical protein